MTEKNCFHKWEGMCELIGCPCNGLGFENCETYNSKDAENLRKEVTPSKTHKLTTEER